MSKIFKTKHRNVHEEYYQTNLNELSHTIFKLLN